MKLFAEVSAYRGEFWRICHKLTTSVQKIYLCIFVIFSPLTNKILIILQKVIKKLGSFIFVLYLCNQKQGTNTTIYKIF